MPHTKACGALIALERWWRQGGPNTPRSNSPPGGGVFIEVVEANVTKHGWMQVPERDLALQDLSTAALQTGAQPSALGEAGISLTFLL